MAPKAIRDYVRVLGQAPLVRVFVTIGPIEEIEEASGGTLQILESMPDEWRDQQGRGPGAAKCSTSRLPSPAIYAMSQPLGNDQTTGAGGNQPRITQTPPALAWC
ncbi:MAG: hypothetical protein AMXMBFR26_00270 [Porticoccaceae bacterium]